MSYTHRTGVYVRALFLVARSLRRIYVQGPREVQQLAMPSWKVYFEAFIANPEVALGQYNVLAIQSTTALVKQTCWLNSYVYPDRKTFAM